MSIFFDKERQAWSLQELTQEEVEVLLDLGKEELLARLGASIVIRLKQEQAKGLMEQDFLDTIPTGDMGQA